MGTQSEKTATMTNNEQQQQLLRAHAGLEMIDYINEEESKNEVQTTSIEEVCNLDYFGKKGPLECKNACPKCCYEDKRDCFKPNISCSDDLHKPCAILGITAEIMKKQNKIGVSKSIEEEDESGEEKEEEEDKKKS